MTRWLFRSELEQGIVLLQKFLHESFDDLGLGLSRLLLIFLHQAVESIFNLNLSAAFDLKTYLVPFAPHLLPEFEDFELLLHRPLVSFHVRVNHVDPPLATLPRFPVATPTHSLVELLCDPSPLFRLNRRTGGSHGRARRLHCDLLSDAFQNVRFSGCPGSLLSLDVLDE